MTLVASRIVNDFSYVMRINHEIHFAWQAQYLVKLEMTLVAPRIVNDVSYVMRINIDSCSFSAKFHGLDLCAISGIRQYYSCIGFYLSNFFFSAISVD